MRNREIYIQCNNNRCGVWICTVIRWSVVIAGGMTIKSKKTTTISFSCGLHSLEVETKSINQSGRFIFLF